MLREWEIHQRRGSGTATPAGGPRDIGQQPVKPPGAAGGIGAGGFQRIAYRHEPALQPGPVAVVQAGRAEQPLRHKQPRGHVTRVASRLESREYPPPGAHFAPLTINGQQNPRIRLHRRLQASEGFLGQAHGGYAGFCQVIAKKGTEVR